MHYLYTHVWNTHAWIWQILTALLCFAWLCAVRVVSQLRSEARNVVAVFERDFRDYATKPVATITNAFGKLKKLL
jgi:protein-S-isoprenylcysteine O-methyltransferase Ste14